MDYRGLAERMNAISLFEAYIEVFDVMSRTEPKLLKTAVAEIKKKKSFNLNMKQLKRIKRLYPLMVPFVFSRLWDKELEPEQAMLREKIVERTKEAWLCRLKDQGKLDEAVEEKKSAEDQA